MIWHLVSLVVGIVIGVTGTIIYAAAFYSEEENTEDPDTAYKKSLERIQKMPEPRDQHSPDISDIPMQQYNDLMR